MEEFRGKTANQLVAVLACLMGGIMILSNFLATKVWGVDLGFVQMTFDGGIIVYPLTYIIGDMLVEFYGHKLANRVAVVCALLNFITLLMMLLADLLPEAEGVENIVFSRTLGLSFWVFAGSSVGFLGNQVLNNWIFVWLKDKFGTEQIAVRVLGSSVLAHLADLILFNLIAFGIRMNPIQLVMHIGWTYLAGILLEVIFYPLTKYLIQFFSAQIEEEEWTFVNEFFFRKERI